jgi:hypothetical protein
VSNPELDSALADLNRTFGLDVYEAVDVAWTSVVKIANVFPGSSEHARFLEMLNRLSEESVRYILHQQAVDALLNLQPPLETILSYRHERLYAERTARELEVVRHNRDTDPKLALHNLAEVLKRIRNRRAHGFKTPKRARDNEILDSATRILQLIGVSAAEVMGLAPGRFADP